MLCEWTILYFWGHSFLAIRDSRGVMAGLIARICCVVAILGVAWVQSRLYFAITSLQDPAGGHFIASIYIVQHLVAILLLLRAAFKLRRMRGRTRNA